MVHSCEKHSDGYSKGTFAGKLGLIGALTTSLSQVSQHAHKGGCVASVRACRGSIIHSVSPSDISLGA